MPLMISGEKLRVVAAIERVLGVNRLCTLGFGIPVGMMHQQATALNRVEQELPSTSDVAKADDIEL